MGGLAVLLLVGLYLVVAIMVVRAAPGQRAKIVATIAVILIPTADAILGRAYLAYLCGKEGGTKVFRRVEALQGIRLDSFLATQGTVESQRQLLGLYGVSFIESPEKKDGSVDRIVLSDREIVRETGVSPRAKFRSRLISSDHARLYLKNEYLIEALVNGEIVATDTRFSFDGGWAEQFLASFTGAGPGGASRCDLPPLQRETLIKMVIVEETGSGLANCIKVPTEGFGESSGLSRAFLETGEHVAESGDIASEGLRQRGQRRGVGLQCQPGEGRAHLGRQSRAACVFPTALWTGGKQRWPRAISSPFTAGSRH